MVEWFVKESTLFANYWTLVKMGNPPVYREHVHRANSSNFETVMGLKNTQL